MTDPSLPDPARDALRFRRAFLLLLVAGISVLFLFMIGRFLLAVLLGALFAGMASPLYRWLCRHFGGRRAPAAVLTVLVLVVGVGLPLAGFLALVAAEAVQVAQWARGWFEGQEDRLEQIRTFIETRVPLADRLLPDGEELLEQLQGVAERTGAALMGGLAAATRGVLTFILQLFILLYSIYFFLIEGPALLKRIVGYLPLSKGEEEQLLERFISVARATLKGSLLIGVIQGGVAGLAFWVAGVPGPAFWGTVMVVLSIVPAVGAALVWIPAVIYLFTVGQTAAGVGLLIWCAVVVSTLDNLLRPRLIGRDARMSDLLILVSTLGGIVLFGAVGFILGPIVAALFVTVWHIYGEAFREWLPDTASAPAVAGPPASPGVGTAPPSVAETPLADGDGD